MWSTTQQAQQQQTLRGQSDTAAKVGVTSVLPHQYGSVTIDSTMVGVYQFAASSINVSVFFIQRSLVRRVSVFALAT